MKLFSADWIFPVAAPPIAEGALAVSGNRIVSVGKKEKIFPEFPGAPRRIFPKTALLPGLVNAHTHLELTLLKNRLPETDDFISWILSLIEARKKITEEEILRSIETGVDHSIRAGTTCLGEISNTEKGLPILRKRGLRAVVFREILGRRIQDPDRWIAQIRGTLATMESQAGPTLTPGLSPHSPYTLSGKALKILGRILQSLRVPYTIHVAESMAEIDYFSRRAGAIPTRFFPAVGWSGTLGPEQTGTPLDALRKAGLLTNRLLIVHGVHLTGPDLDRIAEKRASIVLCPRSNRFLKVGSPPVRAILGRGIIPGFGTDSLASNHSLSIWDEMRSLLAPDPTVRGVSAELLLRMATRGGAACLGLESKIGSLEPGKEADLIAVRFDPGACEDPTAALIRKTRDQDVRMVMVAGKTLLDPGEAGTVLK